MSEKAEQAKALANRLQDDLVALDIGKVRAFPVERKEMRNEDWIDTDDWSIVAQLYEYFPNEVEPAGTIAGQVRLEPLVLEHGEDMILTAIVADLRAELAAEKGRKQIVRGR